MRYSLVTSLGCLRSGAGDPTIRLAEGEIWWARWTPDGPTTVRLVRHGDRVNATTWGSGGASTLERLPALLGVGDRPKELTPLAEHRVLAGAVRQDRLRMPRTGHVTDCLVQTILEQKVTSRGAHRSWAALVRRDGATAPGPEGVPVRLPPPPERLAEMPYNAWHPLGVERKRAVAVQRACRHLARLQDAVGSGSKQLEKRLTAIPGIGPWTAAIIRRAVLGDPDAVEVGDWNLPHLVTYNLAGERRGDDARMLELLEPYRGQRGRVVLLLRLAGRRPPRRTHRWEVRDIRGI